MNGPCQWLEDSEADRRVKMLAHREINSQHFYPRFMLWGLKPWSDDDETFQRWNFGEVLRLTGDTL